MPQFKCPHCEEEITELRYHEDATIYGSYDIETEDYEHEETEGNGRIKFTCPECDENINSADDLINVEEREIIASRDNTRLILREKEERRELPVPEAIEQNWKGEYSGFHNSNDRQKQSAIIICPKCGSKNEAIENETIECYKCNKEINLLNAKKIIQIENN